MDGTLTGATIPSQSRPGSNGSEETQHIPPEYQYWSLPIRWFVVNIQDTGRKWGVLPLYRDAVSIFYSPGWLSWYIQYTHTYIYV